MKKNLFNLKIATLAAGMLFSTAISAQFTAVTSGNWSSGATWGGTAPSPTVSNQNITIPSGITVDMDQDVTFSGLLNTFMVNGVLTNTTSNWILMTSGSLSGTGTVSISKLRLTSLSTLTFGGTLNLKSMSNSVASLAFASIANITDTLELENGNLSLNTNGNLTMMTGSTIKVGGGTMAINSGVFNSSNAYNIMYVGINKTSGVEFNSTAIQHVYLNMNDNTQSVKLGSNATVNGTIYLQKGMLDLNGKKATLKGDLMITSGAMFQSNGTSDMEIQGTGTLSSTLMFNSGSSMHDLTINRTATGQVKLGNALSIGGNLNLMEGTMSVENGGNLAASSNSTIHIEKGMLSLNSGTFTGLSNYSVEYAGSTDATSGIELNGTGLNGVMVNYASNTNRIKLNSNTTVIGMLHLKKGKLDLNGKTLILNGIIQQSTESRFVGSTSSELDLNLSSVTQDTVWFDESDAAAHTLNTLKVNTTGPTWVVLGNKLIVSNLMQFNAGKLELGNGDLEIMSNATIVGYDDTKYIVTSENSSGVLIQNVNSGSSYVAFPIGLSTNYSPAYVQQTSTGTSGNFSAKCYSVNTYAVKSVNRIWMVSGTGVTTINANIKFAWKQAAETNGFDRTNAYVSHFTNSMWDVTAAGSASAGVNSTFELSRLGLTSLSPFAVVENGSVVGINEASKTLTGTDIYPNPSKDVINIKVSNTNDTYQYEVIDITGRTILAASNTNSLTKFDVSDLNSGCYFVKVTNLNTNKTETKRFIKH